MPSVVIKSNSAGAASICRVRVDVDDHHKTEREYPLWSTIRNNMRWSIRLTPNKPIAIVYGDINDSTLHCPATNCSNVLLPTNFEKPSS
jgi:hypothetical protein